MGCAVRVFMRDVASEGMEMGCGVVCGMGEKEHLEMV